MSQGSKKRIAIVGAGYTGLVAAYRLAKKGYAVEIFEAGSYPGGLAGDFKIEGAPLEIAYHHLFKTDTDIIALTKELGVNDQLKWHDSSLSIYYKGKLYPFMTALDLIKFTPLSLPNRIRAGLVVLYLQKQKNWKPFINQSALSWMRKAAGKQVCEVIWEPLLRGKFDKYYDKVSMAWLWARIHIRANSREKGDSGEKLGYFDGGFKVLTDTLVEACKSLGVTIRLQARIEHIDSSQKPFLMIEGKKQFYDSIIATTPSHILAKLIEQEKPSQELQKYMQQLTSIDYLGAVLMVFSSDQDISPYYWHNINDIDKPFLVFIHHTRLVSKEFYGGKHVYYIGAYLPADSKLFGLDDQELSKLWLGELKKIFPEFSKEQISEKYIFRLRNAQHIVGTDYQSKIPKHETPLAGVFLSNFSQIFPEDRGTNYAVREGNKIAETADKYLSRKG